MGWRGQVSCISAAAVREGGKAKHQVLCAANAGMGPVCPGASPGVLSANSEIAKNGPSSSAQLAPVVIGCLHLDPCGVPVAAYAVYVRDVYIAVSRQQKGLPTPCHPQAPRPARASEALGSSGKRHREIAMVIHAISCSESPLGSWLWFGCRVSEGSEFRLGPAQHSLGSLHLFPSMIAPDNCAVQIPNGIGVLLGLGQLALYARYHHIEVVSESRRHMMSKSMSQDCLAEEGEGERARGVPRTASDPRIGSDGSP